MTVHKAKGLEFPIVVLADMTARLCASAASRTIDSERGVCAIRLAGCAPVDLIEHDQEELARDEAEGTRVAYVAATRARDLLVIPAVGDEQRQGWLQPLNSAIYPPPEASRRQMQAPGCPEFKSKDSVLVRPRGGPAETGNVCPGLYIQKQGAGSGEFSVVWWDPHALKLGAEAPLGIRRPELIVKDVPEEIVESGLAAYRSWRERRDRAIAAGAIPTVAPRTVTESAKTAAEASPGSKPPPVQTVRLPRLPERPSGRRFGTLVHAVLASVPLDAEAAVIQRLATIHGRILAADAKEIASVSAVVEAALVHPLLEAARQAAAKGRCRREVPVLWRERDGSLIEGVVDLAFEQAGGWMVIDFKTDQELHENEAAYKRQVAMYAAAVQAAMGAGAVSGVLMQL
jgi:ATP-dependent exoDNAse (exonuclease V) beta subunit